MILKYVGKSGKSRISFRNAGTFEFTPECEIPDEFKEAIDYLLEDGYLEVKGKPQAKKDEPVEVIIPEKKEKPANNVLTCSCGKECASEFGLMAHKRHCKK